MRRRLWLIAGLILGLVPGGGSAQDPVPPLVRAVAGIVSFTRWPGPLSTVTLCVVGPGRGVEGLLAGPMQAGGVVVSARLASLGDRLDECHAVYVGRLSLVDRRQLHRRLEGMAVLTLGEAGPDCTELVMFCLRDEGDFVAFSTNIDMIARGGVRLNPRVLLLGRRPGVGP